MISLRSLLFALALGACATAEISARDPAPVIAAERAFAARAGEIGWIPAFREFVAADAQLVGRTGIVNAPERLAALEDDGDRNLYWAPAFAGIARSGDLGFTTGPASVDAAKTPIIQYFTVWRRQPDGTWKWIYDGGPGPVATPGPYLPEGASSERLAVAAGGVGSSGGAITQVEALERSAATAAGLAQYLAASAHVYRSGQLRAYGGAAAAAAMLYPSADTRFRLVRVEASEAGDLVFTLGEAAWAEAGAERAGYFARIWQFQGRDWRIVYDQLVIPAPPPAHAQ